MNYTYKNKSYIIFLNFIKGIHQKRQKTTEVFSKENEAIEQPMDVKDEEQQTPQIIEEKDENEEQQTLQTIEKEDEDEIRIGMLMSLTNIVYC